MKSSLKILSILILTGSLSATALADATETPVVNFSMEDNNAYGFFSQAEFSNTWSNNNAAAFLLGFGANQFRIGVDWAHAFNAQQRLNIGIEHLGQNSNFAFSTGVDHKYIGQNAIGSTYQYLVNDSVLKDIDLSGYYAVAQDVSFTPIFANNAWNIRDVTGANSGGLSAGGHVQFWHSGWLGLALDYDNVYFPMHYEAPQGSSGFGFTASWVQLLSSNTAFMLSAAPHEPYQVYEASLNWLAHQTTHGQLAFGVYGEHLNSRLLPVSSQNILGLNLTYNWGAVTPQSAATLYNPVAHDLLAWTQNLPSQLPGVFAVRDQSWR